MDAVNRRDAVKWAAAGLVVAAGAVSATKAGAAPDTPPAPEPPPMKELKAKDKAPLKKPKEGSGVYLTYVPLAPAAEPGWNSATITLEDGWKAVAASAWATEEKDGASHAGTAIFNTSSVQLTSSGNIVRVIFALNAMKATPAGVQLLIGYQNS